MLNFRFLAPWTLWIATSQASAAIVLACSGYTEQTGNGPTKRDPVTVTITINEGDDALKINGWWGCLANMGQEAYDRGGARDKCDGFLLYTATSTEFTFSDTSTGKDYSGGTRFTLDRVTGKFSGISYATAKPPSGASWTYMSINTEMVCKPATRAF